MPNDIKVLIGEKNSVELDEPTEHQLIADEIPYNNTASGLVAEELQAAVDEMSSGGGGGASPGYILGDGGNSTKGTYLSNAGVPSNIVGIPIGVTNPRLKQITLGNQNSNIWSVTIVEHDGVTFTDITTVEVNPAARGAIFNVDFPLTKGKELAARIADNSASSAKNAKVTCILKGST